VPNIGYGSGANTGHDAANSSKVTASLSTGSIDSCWSGKSARSTRNVDRGPFFNSGSLHDERVYQDMRRKNARLARLGQDTNSPPPSSAGPSTPKLRRVPAMIFVSPDDAHALPSTSKASEDSVKADNVSEETISFSDEGLSLVIEEVEEDDEGPVGSALGGAVLTLNPFVVIPSGLGSFFGTLLNGPHAPIEETPFGLESILEEDEPSEEA